MARFFGTVFFASVLFFVTLATGCSRFKPMERAERLEQHGHPEQALEIYKSQLARTPEYDRVQQADLQFHMGECLLALDRTREAFSAFNRAVELDDSHPTAHLRLGEMYLMSGSLDHASEQAQKILERNNGNLDALALLGAAASAGGNDGVARNAFEDVLEKDPTRVKVALSLADLLTRRGETKTARIVLQRTAQAQPKSPLPWLTLGRLEETLGRIDEAEKDYRHAVVVEDSPETNLRLAQFLERTARIDEAKQILLHVDALRPAFRTARGDLELISGHATQAQERYLQSLNGFTSDSHSKDPESRARTVSRLVEADLAAGGPKAVKLARVHLDYFRDSVDQATREILLTEIALADSDFSTAKVHAAAAVQLAPDSAAAQYIDGVTKLRLGDLSAARSACESSLDNDSDYIPSHIEMSKLLLDQGDIQGAEQMIVPTVREEPANVAALVAFGHVLISEHDLDSARVIAARIHSAAPDSIAADLMEGEIALADQDGGRALLSFQKA
ncbi:MAG TPA: tetratricopeptide repeat protein, partial [Terriglobales bacterium]